MPFVSEAQRRKLMELAQSGHKDPAMVQQLHQETGNKKLPERTKKHQRPSRPRGAR